MRLVNLEGFKFDLSGLAYILPTDFLKIGEYFMRQLQAMPQTEIIRCKNCKHRHTEDCPMYHVEWVEYDDDGYIEMDDIEYDNTEDDGFCYKGVRYGFN